MLTGISHEALVEALDALPKVDLEAVTLFRVYRRTQQPPADLEQVAHATEQLVKYTGVCTAFADNLDKLPAVPVYDPMLVEAYPL